jgi:RNA polymerase sigma-70 factor (ECF subfamily)
MANMDEKNKQDLKDSKHAEYMNFIMTYILMMVPRSADAEDILQETAALMRERFDQYRTGTDFASWGAIIARYKIMELRRMQSQQHVTFSNETLNLISDYAGKRTQGIHSIQEWLGQCLSRLNQQDRTLVEMRYGNNITTRELARRIGRPVQGLYSSMSRIHGFLLECIQRHRRAESV